MLGPESGRARSRSRAPALEATEHGRAGRTQHNSKGPQEGARFGVPGRTSTGRILSRSAPHDPSPKSSSLGRSMNLPVSSESVPICKGGSLVPVLGLWSLAPQGSEWAPPEQALTNTCSFLPRAALEQGLTNLPGTQASHHHPRTQTYLHA